MSAEDAACNKVAELALNDLAVRSAQMQRSFRHCAWSCCCISAIGCMPEAIKFQRACPCRWQAACWQRRWLATLQPWRPSAAQISTRPSSRFEWISPCYTPVLLRSCDLCPVRC